MDTSPGASASQSEVVRLNIGGHKYVTTISTLTGNGTQDNYFTRMLSGRMPLAYMPDEKEAPQWLFVDRNGRYFEPLLDFLRTGEWMVPRGMDERLVLREAEFYCIKVPRFGDLAVSNVAMHNQASAYDVVLKPRQRLVRFLERLMLNTLTQEKPSLDLPATPWISVWPRAEFVSHRHPGVLGVEPQVKLTLNDIVYFDPTSLDDMNQEVEQDEEGKDMAKDKDKPINSWGDLPTLAAAMVWHMRQRHRLTVSADWASFQAEYRPTGVTPGFVRHGATTPLLQFRWCPPASGASSAPPSASSASSSSSSSSSPSLWTPPSSLNPFSASP